MNEDCVYLIICKLPVKSILINRILNKSWRNVVDSITNKEWKNMYIERLKWVDDVSAHFDWKTALINAEEKQPEVEACCTWNSDKIKIIAPWIFGASTIVTDETVLLDLNLRSGVERILCRKHQGIYVQFIYDEAFELRGVRQTCARRHITPCHNCQQRKFCINQRYIYYVRKYNKPFVNDYFSMRVRGIA